MKFLLYHKKEEFMAVKTEVFVALDAWEKKTAIIGSIFKEKKNKQQYINIKVDKARYSEIINLLQDNGLLEYCIVK